MTATTGSRPSSVEEAVPDDAADRRDAVLPGDLLPRIVSSPVVRDRDFVDPAAEARDLRRELGLEPEPVGAEPKPLQERRAEDLVAGLHVRQVQVGEHVREHRQEPVADVMPEEEDTMGFSAEPG